ncbi:hypothetical protein [Dactylosporangium sp. CA-092794]|uniref:hypothetical protein n=1 Tax=Dactylosporangium sp. CA-092794 TaxID=3239929 RepID=UPI003D8D3C3B
MPTGPVAGDRRRLLALFGAMRSGSGFLHDLRPMPDVTAAVRQPAMIVATRRDGGMPFARSRSWPPRSLGPSWWKGCADGHFVCYAADWPAIARLIQAFVAAAPSLRLTDQRATG